MLDNFLYLPVARDSERMGVRRSQDEVSGKIDPTRHRAWPAPLRQNRADVVIKRNGRGRNELKTASPQLRH
jgi:hypothetical protein